MKNTVLPVFISIMIVSAVVTSGSVDEKPPAAIITARRRIEKRTVHQPFRLESKKPKASSDLKWYVNIFRVGPAGRARKHALSEAV